MLKDKNQTKCLRSFSKSEKKENSVLSCPSFQDQQTKPASWIGPQRAGSQGRLNASGSDKLPLWPRHHACHRGGSLWCVFTSALEGAWSSGVESV